MLVHPLLGDQSQEAVALIYYIPFNIETYVPVTVDDIEKRAHLKLVLLEESDLLGRLAKLLSDNKVRGSFDGRVVRLKVVLKKEVYFVDADGGVKHNGSEYTINPDEIEKIVKELLKKYPAKSKAK